MNQSKIINNTKAFIQQKLLNEGSGHDYWHAIRVYNNALAIAKAEDAGDEFIIAITALLHDVADHKFGYTDDDRTKIITEYLSAQHVSKDIIDSVIYIINHMSYKNGTNTHKLSSIEGQIVQDADRLDAIGAIGIARTFTFGGHFNRVMYNPDKQSGETDTVEHFYDKLLLLKDKMNTQTGKEIAQSRHQIILDYLDEFYSEWKGEFK